MHPIRSAEALGFKSHAPLYYCFKFWACLRAQLLVLSLPHCMYASADWAPPTVADTKKKFYETFRKPVPGLYNNVIQELLVQQHIMRYNKKYRYDEVSHTPPSLLPAGAPIMAQISCPLSREEEVDCMACQSLSTIIHCAHGVYVRIHPKILKCKAFVVQVFALGFVSVFDQVLEGLPDGDRENLFKAYLSSLDEDPSKYRQVPSSCQPYLSDISAQ